VSGTLYPQAVAKRALSMTARILFSNRDGRVVHSVGHARDPGSRDGDDGDGDNPIPRRPGVASRQTRHVVFINKENATHDLLIGDITVTRRGAHGSRWPCSDERRFAILSVPGMAAPRRFADQGQRVYDFMDEILVVCPRCAGCARTFRLPGRNDLLAPRRLACVCGYSKDWSGNTMDRPRRGAILDGYFGLPLWLQADCAGDTLWAFNAAHLDVIDAFVAAPLRTRARDPQHGWQ